ncbi:unnamed protein product [Brassica rapa]|uniref:DUF7950 domain-containing protein n=1 Tax=Brassica campestris TaxID=3711 RepID=A0A8D9H4M0_BRACM|nr:unnamed protein product [Brassica rapa]
MNFRGGCCIERYGGSGGDMSKVDRIMLRYRPIAPRPDSGGSSSPPLDSVSPKSRRGKRKYSKENSSSSGGSVNSNGNSKRRRNEEAKNGSETVTLPLLPETPERRKEPPRVLVPAAASSWLSFGDDGRYQAAKKSLDLTEGLLTARTETVVSSLLTVECVTEGEYELGCTDEEKKMNLERDTCPGFISDGLGRVVWTNGSYRDLVIGKDKCCSKMSVWLVMKEKPLLTKRTFTCRMRLQYTCRDSLVSSITSPCDGWKMNDGGFAWRLDVNAALFLGRHELQSRDGGRALLKTIIKLLDMNFDDDEVLSLVEKYGTEETKDAIKKIPRSKFMNIFSPMQNEKFLKDIFNLNKDTQEYLDSRGLSIALRSLGFVFSEVNAQNLAHRLTGSGSAFGFNYRVRLSLRSFCEIACLACIHMNVVREVPVGTVRVGSWDDIVLCLHTVIGAMIVAMVGFLPKPSPSPTVSASSNNTASPIPPLLPFIYNKNKNLGSIVLMSYYVFTLFMGR